LPPQPKVDADGKRADPNHFKGEKVTQIAGGTRTIAWDLTHNTE
jgi:hypothetical protein